MLKSYTFGCGQGATKAMIHAIDCGVLDSNYCTVINSTSKDIPNDYLSKAIIISDDPNAGCGKVRDSAKKLMLKYLKQNPNVIGNILFSEENPIDYVNIIATSEGASGSGASIVLAKYIKHIAESNGIDMLVNIILITGFESDTRGLQNTINYFKDLNGADYTIRIVSNKKYLEDSATTFEAEEKANSEMASVLQIIGCEGIIDSDHNIDDTDHFRLISNPGLLFTGEVNMNTKKYKNTDQLNKDISDMIDYTSSLDFTPSATKLGIYLNISEDNMKAVDTTFTIIKKKLCGTDSVPELFIHKQYDGGRQFVRVIASGMSLPTEEVEKMYNTYQENMMNSNNNKNDFFDKLNSMETDGLSSKSNTKTVSNNFFDDFETEDSDETDSVMRRTMKSKPSFKVSSASEVSTKSESKFKTQSHNQKESEYEEDKISKY